MQALPCSARIPVSKQNALVCPSAGRCRQIRSTARCKAGGMPDTSAFRRLMFLPGGAWFMSRDTSDDPVYGDSFIMHAPTQQQGQQQQVQGLVLQRQKPRGVAVRQPQPSCEIVPLLLDEVEVSIVVLPMEEKSLGIVPFKQMVRDVAVSIMPFDQPLLEPPASSSDSSSCLAIVPRESNTMLGVVMGSAVRRRDDGLQLPMNDDSVYETFNTKHKRRTMKIKFKCRRCGATTIKPINPHAWTNGTVFAKCGRCNITHKLIDNLKLFHELSGPVFNNPIQPINSGNSSSGFGAQQGPGFEGEQGLELQYDSNGFPVLPERLQLRLKPWQAPQDFPDDVSNFN